VIPDHTHWFGLSSWRWLLILEGITAIHELSLFPEHLGAVVPRSIVLLEQVFTKSPSKARHTDWM
jgi:hypothetical protein